MQQAGRVYLVDGGPGDPGLLTLRAMEVLRTADVVVHDRLVAPEILEQVPQRVVLLATGKTVDHRSLVQAEVCATLARLALAGRQVVRLLGGDAFVLGWGSEEALALARSGIAFEIVPGVTAAAASAAYSGVPLTHRGLSRGVRFLAGHLRSNQRLEPDWGRLASSETTLAACMSLPSLERLCQGLLEHGMDPATPGLLVQDGTTPRQRRVFGDISTLAERARGSGLGSPVLVLIGRTVALAGELEGCGPSPTPQARPDEVTA